VYGLCVCNDFDRSVRVLANGCPKLKYFVFRFTQKQNVTHHTNFNFLNLLQHARIEMIPFAVINSECAKDRCFKKGQCTDNSNRKLSVISENALI
jgi:O-phosphoseryl-tRNA(Cys) synthetase